MRNLAGFARLNRSMTRFLVVTILTAGVLAATAQNRRPGRGPDRAPALGAAIPKVTAKSRDGKETVVLNSPERLTVLVFGSHT